MRRSPLTKDDFADARVLRSYVFGPRLERGGRLLFPSFRAGQESRLVDVRKLIDRIAMRAGWKRGEIRCRIFRHTYTAARLQTLDHGAPISLYTVTRELGHGSEDMVRRVYSHLGTFRHRSEMVEYRVEQHFERLGDQLIRLGFDTTIVTNRVGEQQKLPRSHRNASGGKLPEWARRDSNARPLAPEAQAGSWPALAAAEFVELRVLMAYSRWPALTGFVTTDVTTEKGGRVRAELRLGDLRAGGVRDRRADDP